LTDQAIRVVPAGWYEDPASRAHVRWWNGLAWTEHTALKPTEQPRPQQPTYQQTYGEGGYQQGAQGVGQGAAEGVAQGAAAGAAQQAQQEYAHQNYQAAPSNADQDAVARAAAALAAQNAETAARVAEARELERQYGISTEEHDIIVRRAAEGDDHQPAHNSAGTAYDPNAYGTANWDDGGEDYEDEPRTGTASAWLISLWPILTLVALAAAAYYYFFVSPEPTVAGIPLVAGVAVVPYLFTLIWAALDARKLRNLGNRPASPALALLGPLVYLIARRTRVKGVGPLVTLIILTLIAVGAPIAALQTGAAAPTLKAVEIQQAIRADLVDGGQLGSISCDPQAITSIAQGTQFTCDATLPDGTPKSVWVSIDDREGHFSYAIAVK
jgi:hypothetical protein